MNPLTRALIAEFIGTLALVFFGCLSIVIAQDRGGSLVTVALAFGLVLAVFVPVCIALSGAQFNPAVSIALTLIGKQDPMRTALYVLVQLLAAACGAGMVVLVMGREAAEAARVGASLGELSDKGLTLRVFLLEAVMTFALVFVALATLARGPSKPLIGIAVGGIVAVCVVTGGPLTGASMNPARSFGPALYGHWEMHWVYWLAPILGASLAAALVCRVLFPDETPEAS